jgi:prepilin-type N-terminal cleavage/methylation domain-containing protein
MMQPKRNQKGFTLIELLVVIGILAALAAVAIPTYARFFGQGEDEANQTELSNIQAAMDAMLAQNGLKLVDEHLAPGTDDFSALPEGIVTLTQPESLYPEFLRFGNADNPTKCLYTWDTSGKLKQSSCP